MILLRFSSGLLPCHLHCDYKSQVTLVQIKDRMFKKISVQDVQYIEFFNHYGIENQSACGGLQQSFDVCYGLSVLVFS